MSPEDMVTPADPCGADVAAYALGALDPHETEAFERHLVSCAVCPVELASFQQVVDAVAASAPPVQASRALRRRVLGAVADQPRRPAVQRAPRRFAVRTPSLGFGGLAFGGGLAFAVAAVVVAVIALPGRMGNRTIDATVAGTGTAALQISSGHAQIVVHHLSAPPRGKIYEVWLQHGKHVSPTTALFGVNRQGDASVDVPGSLYGVSHVLVTPEPAGGSRTPTHPPVINASV